MLVSRLVLSCLALFRFASTKCMWHVAVNVRTAPYTFKNSCVNCCLLLLVHSQFPSIQVFSKHKHTSAYLMPVLFIYASLYCCNGASFKMIIDYNINRTKPHIYYSGRSSSFGACVPISAMCCVYSACACMCLCVSELCPRVAIRFHN